MKTTSRAALAMGFGVLGLAGLVGVSYGQGDGAVRKTSGNSTPTSAQAAAPTGKAAIPIATIDLEAVLRGYEKAKFQVDQLKAESLAKQGQLKGIFSEAQAIAKEMEALQPSSQDFKIRSQKLNELKAKLTAGKENLEGEDRMKYVEIMAGCYKEAQEMTKNWATSRGISCVIKISNEPIDTGNPDSVMAAMARPIMYSDATLDITRSVLWNLNNAYVKSGGPVVKTPAAGDAPTDDATAPASATQSQAQPKASASRPAPKTMK